MWVFNSDGSNYVVFDAGKMFVHEESVGDGKRRIGEYVWEYSLNKKHIDIRFCDGRIETFHFDPEYTTRGYPVGMKWEQTHEILEMTKNRLLVKTEEGAVFVLTRPGKHNWPERFPRPCVDQETK